jgi:AraC-like DNA-binding protein/quercetin dioxygenase-like cupin family protein
MDKDRRKSVKMDSPPQTRSTESLDYQTLPVAVSVMPKHFPNNSVVEPHEHQRDQLIYAIAGLMRVSTGEDTWIVPPDRALYMPAGIEHSIEMRGDVEMRTLYIAPTDPSETKVLAVHALLRELISSLADTPADYSGNPRAEKIADLILLELKEAEGLPLNIPMPRDKRLQALCQIILDDASNSLTLEQLSVDLGASPKTLARICAQELGMNFSIWRRRVRFSNSLELLEKRLPIKQIASDCGYSGPSAFAHAFSQEFGMSPSAYHERN